MGTSIIQFTAISGVHSEDPLCYLLEMDECRILLDCGWDEHFDPADLSELKKVAPSVDFVLLSHPDLAHVGALPYAIRELGLKKECLVVSTMPCWKMGQMALYDAYACRSSAEDFKTFTLDDVDRAFGRGNAEGEVKRFKHLEYQEKFDLPGGTGISVTPFLAGHMLGSSVWKIAKASEDDVVVYAVDVNNRKERMLDGGVLEMVMSDGLRPAVLITDAFNAQYTQSKKRGVREKSLVTTILKTLRGGGNVLLPIDTAGRVFELLLLLDDRWHRDRLSGQYPLVLLNEFAYTVVEQATGYTQWMRDDCNFRFESVQSCHSLEELDAKVGVDRPKVVLASFASLETGMARELFIKWAAEPRNTVLFTQRSHTKSLGRTLVDFHLQNQPPPRSMLLHVKERVALEGEELRAFRERELEEAEVKREEADAQRRAEEETSIEVAAEEDEETIDSEEEDESKTEELVKSSRMFGCTEEMREFDDYGELIRAEDFMEEDPHLMPFSYAEAMEEEVSEGAVAGAEVAGVSVPTKCVSGEREVDIGCSVEYIDFEGRYDKNDLNNILKRMQPHKIVIVHATHASTEHLRTYCEHTLQMAPGNVFAPWPRETLNVTSERKVHPAQFHDALYKSLDIFDLGQYSLAHVEATVHMRDGDDSVAQIELRQRDADDSSRSEAHAVTIIGDVKFGNLRARLNEEGIDAKFKDGMLICCKNRVRIKKSKTADTFEIEGAICKDYYRIRDILYGQFDFF